MRAFRGAAAAIALLSAALLPAAGCGGGGSNTCRPAASFPTGLDHGPMVALPAPTEMTVAWWTTEPVVGGVEWGPDGTYGASAFEPTATGAHRVTLHGLSPATPYHYRLLSDGEPLGGDHVLSSAPSSASGPVRFSVLGDTGTGCEPELQVVDRVAADAPDFVLVTGDVAYGSGTAEQVRDGWSIPFAPLLERVPVFPCLGNHDVDTRGGQPLFDATVLPANDSTGTSQFYSFDYGPLHVVALDSNGDLRPGHSQRDWLAADLAATTAPWRVVFFHHPAYSSSNHGSTGSVDANLVPLFDAARVDLVFNGHDHDYERTFPMVDGIPAATADEPDYVDPPGPLYVVTGGGGQHLYGAGTSAFTAVSASVHHHVTVDVSGSVLTLTATRTDGTTLDRMTITKTR